MKQTFNLERATLDAANDIIKNGFQGYFDTGVRLGFYDPKEEDKIIENIISNLKQFGREDIIQLVKEKL